MRSRRVPRRPPDLTSLFDVLFIVVFASLIRAAAVQHAAEHPVAPPAVPSAPVTPPAVAALRQHALAAIDAELAARTPLVVRIATAARPDDVGRYTIDALEVDGKRIALGAPLLEHDPDPDVVVSYLGDRSTELRICRIAALHLGAAELSRYLVIIAPVLPLADLPHALFAGLHRDVDRCATEQHGLAVLVDPATLAPTPPPAPRGMP
jgi:hypothetical protein